MSSLNPNEGQDVTKEPTYRTEVVGDVLDTVTAKVLNVLIQHPTIPYNKSQLAEQADVSRDALYDRWDTYIKLGMIQEAEIGGNRTYWTLNPDSEIVDGVARILYSKDI